MQMRFNTGIPKYEFSRVEVSFPLVALYEQGEKGKYREFIVIEKKVELKS